MIRLSNDQALTILNLIKNFATTPGHPLDNIMQNIQDQLASTTHDTDLVDTVARLIGDRGRARNLLTDPKLELLRQAIYSPRELMRLRQVADRMACSSCSNEIQDEQAVCFVGTVLYCSTCIIPSVAACSNCHHAVSIHKALSAAIKKGTAGCEHCEALRNGTAQQPQVAPPNPVAPPVPQAFRVGLAVQPDAFEWRLNDDVNIMPAPQQDAQRQRDVQQMRQALGLGLGVAGPRQDADGDGQ
jgi:hypothetical protein